MSPDYVSEPPQRRDNGLRADQFVALADVDPRLGEHLLDLLRLADIPAYLEPTTDPRVGVRYRSAGPVERLYVQADQRQQARAVVVAAAHEAGEAAAPEVVPPAPATRDDVLFGVDTDAEFERIVSGFTGPSADRSPRPPIEATNEPAADGGDHEIAINDNRLDPASFVLDEDYAGVDTGITGADLDEAARAHARARREAELRPDLDVGEDEEDEHFVPPPAPPFPTPSANTVGAVLLLILGILVLLRGDVFGLGSEASFPVSILLLLSGSALIIRGLRDQPEPGDEPEDDGAEV